jgi:hypothetical protein
MPLSSRINLAQPEPRRGLQRGLSGVAMRERQQADCGEGQRHEHYAERPASSRQACSHQPPRRQPEGRSARRLGRKAEAFIIGSISKRSQTSAEQSQDHQRRPNPPCPPSAVRRQCEQAKHHQPRKQQREKTGQRPNESNRRTLFRSQASQVCIQTNSPESLSSVSGGCCGVNSSLQTGDSPSVSKRRSNWKGRPSQKRWLGKGTMPNVGS